MNLHKLKTNTAVYQLLYIFHVLARNQTRKVINVYTLIVKENILPAQSGSSLILVVLAALFFSPWNRLINTMQIIFNGI